MHNPNMLFTLNKKLALVTGAGRGNGASIAKGLARAGAQVVVIDVDGDSAKQTAELIRAADGTAWPYKLDITNAQACSDLSKQIASEVGLIDVLVNNAGVLLRSPIDGPDAAQQWHTTLNVNVNGPFNMTQAFLPALKSQRGTIVNVASIQSFVAAPTSASYATSKGAVVQFTRTLAAELGPFGIRVNAIAPGIIETAMSADLRADPAKLASFLRHVPLGRAANPDELIGPVVFLASDAASYVTGTILTVDGGYLVV